MKRYSMLCSKLVYWKYEIDAENYDEAIELTKRKLEDEGHDWEEIDIQGDY